MDRETRRRLDEVGFLRGLWIWLIARPDNPDVTIIDRVIAVLCRAAMFLTPVVVVITFYEVVARYVFFSPTLWVNELTLWLGSAIFLTAGVYTMQRRGHIRITAVYDIAPSWLKVAFDHVATLVLVAYATMMISSGFEDAFRTLLRWERFGTYWNPPIPATVKPLVLIATFLVAVQALNNLVVDVYRSRDTEA